MSYNVEHDLFTASRIVVNQDHRRPQRKARFAVARTTLVLSASDFGGKPMDGPK
jgi:hypothetical protein